MHSLEEDEEEDDEDEDEDEDEEGDEDEEDDIESAMNAILGGGGGSSTTAKAARSTSGASSSNALSSKNYFLSSFCGSSTGSSLSATGSTANVYPKLELLINDHVLPSNMTIYQAIKQYGSSLSTPATAGSPQVTENDADSASILNNAIWSKVHLIQYRLAQTPSAVSTTKIEAAAASKQTDSSKRTTRNSTSTSSKPLIFSTKKQVPNKKNADTSASLDSSFISDNGASTDISNMNPDINSTVLFNSLTSAKIKAEQELNDRSIDSIMLLRLLSFLNRDWFLMYQDTLSYESIVSFGNADTNATAFLTGMNEFTNTKLTAKANRQLQDPLVIMTGHLPKWLPELMRTCPFLFPFETRLMYFYVSSLDRDRAMHKLIELNSDMGIPSSQTTDSNHNERIVPKLDRKKKTIVRSNDLIKQADAIISDFAVNNLAKTSSGTAAATTHMFAYGSSTGPATSSSAASKPALLEIQYENEVGTGLGPTLEFYALVSLEIQKCENEMWRGEKIKLGAAASGQNQDQLFFYSASGLFPSPLSLYGKQSSKQQAHVAKIKQKFKFFGKFVAKAVMDFRVLDIQLSHTFYKWLIDSSSLCDQDIKYVDLQLYRSLEHLKDILRQRRSILFNAYKSSTTTNQPVLVGKDVEKQIAQLEKDVTDLDLDFTLPGYSHIELKKNGKDKLVNLENLEEYLNVGFIIYFISLKQQKIS